VSPFRLGGEIAVSVPEPADAIAAVDSDDAAPPSRLRLPTPLRLPARVRRPPPS
jgi:hypothetical protein